MHRVRRRTVSKRLGRVVQEVRSAGDAWLAVRMLAWACCLPILKHVVPLPLLVARVRRTARTSSRNPAGEERIATFARWCCRLTRPSGGGRCLERGLILYRFLGAANARPALVVGFARPSNDALRGHAWVVVDGHPVGEPPESLADFHTAFPVDSEGRLVPQNAVAQGAAMRKSA